MSETPTRFTVEETDDGFVLRHGDVEMRLSQEELYGLRTKLNLWTERVLSQMQARWGTVSPVVTLPVVEAVVWPDAIQANVLLTLTTPGTQGVGTQAVYSLPLPVAEILAIALPHVLAGMRTADDPMTQ